VTKKLYVSDGRNSVVERREGRGEGRAFCVIIKITLPFRPAVLGSESKSGLR
jgi:hypothetical protein